MPANAELIETPRDEFLVILSLLEVAISPTGRETAQQSSCVGFKDGWMITYSDEVSCRVPGPMPDDFEGAVKASSLLKVLGKFPDDRIVISVEGNHLVFSGAAKTKRGRGKRKLRANLESELLMPVESVKFPKTWRPLPERFAEAVAHVRPCAGNDETKYRITCVHVHPKWVEATDDRKFCRWPMDTGFPGPVLIRQNSLKGLDDANMIEVGETTNWIHFRSSSDLILSCRRYGEEDFPDYGPVIDFDGEVISLPKSLVEVIERAEIVSKEVKDRNYVTVTLDDGLVTVSGEGLSGDYEEERPVRYDGPRICFVCPPRVLADIIQKHAECKVTKDRVRAESPDYVYLAHLMDPSVLKLPNQEEAEG